MFALEDLAERAIGNVVIPYLKVVSKSATGVYELGIATVQLAQGQYLFHCGEQERGSQLIDQAWKRAAKGAKLVEREVKKTLKVVIPVAFSAVVAGVIIKVTVHSSFTPHIVSN